MHKPHHGLARQPGPPLKPRRQVILMCPPGHFGVSYIINPWMDDQIGKVDRACATYQWENLRKILAQRADLVFIPPEPGLPDLVFTANAGLVLGDSVIVSRFSSAERRAEEPFIRAWFERSGFRIVPWPPAIAFEGAGDALIDRAMPRLWVGHSFRTDAAASAVLEQLTGLATIALNLVDPRLSPRYVLLPARRRVASLLSCRFFRRLAKRHPRPCPREQAD